MADRYWVGGTASWDGTAGSKWALTSGGAGGQAVPTSADDVFFDAASGAVTCTIAYSGSCLSLNFTGFTGTFAGGSGSVTLNGNLTLASGMTWTQTGGLSFSAAGTKTITSNGKSITAPITISTIGIVVQLADAFSTTNAIALTSGTFTTNNFNITADSLSSSNSNTRTINLGSSTCSFSGALPALNFSTSTNLTFNAGTSQINCSASGANFNGGGVTFYNVAFTGTGTGTRPITGANTFNNLAITGPSSAGVNQITFANPCTISGTLSTTGTAGNRRLWFRGTTEGIAQTLTINSAPSLTDANFRDIYVIGTAAPISGTRIGNLAGCSGITFSTPKTVYWVTLAGGNWSGNNWAATSGGAANTDNFPLAQDTAIIENTGLNTSATVTLDTAIVNLSGINMSTRTNAMTIANASAPSIHGNFTAGSGVTFSTSNSFIFAGRNTQTLTSAGRTIGWEINVLSYGGTLQLADALNVGGNTLYVLNGTFDTKNFNVTAGSLSSSNSNVRAITLGSSTLTLSGLPAIAMATTTNLTLNAGTSSVVQTGSPSSQNFDSTGLTWYNVSFTGTGSNIGWLIAGSNTFNNLSISAPAAAGISTLSFSGNNTINGTLTVAGATAVRRIFVRSDTLGTARTLTANSLSATDCDFRDITIAGAAAGSSPTRAGDCGGNTGITFPGAKTVYWNLAGAQNWSATGWCPSSGGTPDINQFPLAQDTAVFDNTGSVTGTITINTAWNIGTFNASARTSAMTLTTSTNAPFVYGNWLFGTGVTLSSTTGAITFGGRGTSTITSSGVSFGTPITIDCVTGTVQLADALTLTAARTLTHASGTFDAVTYNVTTGLFNNTSTTVASVLKMGSGTWTLSGTGTIWNTGTLTFNKGTANIVLSDTSATARSFNAGTLSYNKLTIGGTTGTSTLTINGNGIQFTELASTKTVAHTISFSTNTHTFGAWTVTGTAGNVVTVSGTGTISIVGARVSGVDYLALGTTVISATSPGEFYAGANSTGGTNAILTAAPSAVTRYWRGGTGTWDATTTTNWSATSGGSGGASVPTSADAVVFDTLSNATAYTVTCTATQLRCAALTMAGPAVGNVTWAGTAPLAVHGNFSLAATGITRSYTGTLTLTGSSTGRTFTTNGVTVAGIAVNGVGCGWTLGGALNAAGSNFTLTNGSFDTAGYTVTCLGFSSQNTNSRTLTLGATTWTISQTSAAFAVNSPNFTFNVGTSTFTFTSSNPQLLVDSGTGPLTFYTASFTNTAIGTVPFNGSFTFTNLTFSGRTSAGVGNISLSANQTINGTLTLSAGTDATMRQFLRSDTIGTTRTLTCAAFAGTDVDFRDITIAGAAAPVSGTRLGDCKGNSGITFGAGVTRYWNLVGGGNWSATGWAATSGGSPAVNNFPLAQDTALFESTGLTSGSTITINAAYNIGTINMSARTSNTMTLATGSTLPTIYGNWINGTGTTLSGVQILTFAGRSSQTITSAGKTFTQPTAINTPGGSVTLQDAFVSNIAASASFDLVSGTFNANNFNVTLSGTNTSFSSTTPTTTRTLALGSGTWTIAGPVWSTNGGLTGLTITGSPTITMTSASNKTFAGGGSTQYSGVTLNQGGAGTLTITGNNTFKDITNTYSATGATNITLGTTTQTVTQFTGTGTSGKVLTIQGTSAASPATLVLTGATKPNVDYLAITGVRAYNLTDTWYAGTNSVNNGSLGWIFAASPVVVTANSNFFFFF